MSAAKAAPAEQPSAEPEPIRAFDPASRFIRIAGKGGTKDYLPTAARVDWLRNEAPDSQIVQIDIQITDTFALFKTTVTRIIDGQIRGTADGFGSETKGDFGDYIEKAATKSLGRALNALGYGGNDLDEGIADGNVVDSPIDRARANAPDPADIRDKEMKRLHAIAAGKFPAEVTTDMKHDALHLLHCQATGQEGLKDASVADLKKLSGWLDAQSPDDSQLKLEWARAMAGEATLNGLAGLREEMSALAKASGAKPDSLMVLILGNRVAEVKKHLLADKQLAEADRQVNARMGP